MRGLRAPGPWLREVLLVAFTYVGTVVGAGFASGREIAHFFLRYGTLGYLGVAVSALLLAVYGAAVLRLGRTAETDSVRACLERCLGRMWARWAEVLLMLFLFGGLCVMLAGGGAAVAQFWPGAELWGIGLMSLLAWITVVAGLHGLRVLNGLVVPALATLTATLLVRTLMGHGAGVPVTPPSGAGPWWAAAYLYASFNGTASLPVLLALGRSGSSATVAGGVAGGLLLGGLCGAISWMLALAGPASQGAELPMLYVAAGQGTWLGHAYAVILFLEMLTTAVANLFGTACVLAGAGLPFRVAAGLVAAAALLFSRAGFGRLVEGLYPLFGLLGAGLFALLATSPLWMHLPRR